MANFDEENRIFGDWFRRQREEHQHTQNSAATWLGVSVKVIQNWERGQFSWALIPTALKVEIQKLFGKFAPEQESDVFANIDFHEGLATEFLTEIEQEINRDSAPKTSYVPEQPPNTIPESLTPNAIDYPELICNRCRTPVPPEDNGRCPGCGFLSDGAQ